MNFDLAQVPGGGAPPVAGATVPTSARRKRAATREKPRRRTSMLRVAYGCSMPAKQASRKTRRRRPSRQRVPPPILKLPRRTHHGCHRAERVKPSRVAGGMRRFDSRSSPRHRGRPSDPGARHRSEHSFRQVSFSSGRARTPGRLSPRSTRISTHES